MRFNRGTRSQLLATIVMFALGIVGITRVSAQSQAFTATISGTVTDSSGGVISGAKVTLVSAERGITRTFTTSESGGYSFALLPPADYVLKVEQSGFQTHEQRGISLAAGASAHLDITMSVGAISQEVVVSAAAPLLNTDNANISADISQKQVVELPLNLRNVFGLASLNSSVNNSEQTQMVNSNGISGSADQDISFLNFGGTFSARRPTSSMEAGTPRRTGAVSSTSHLSKTFRSSRSRPMLSPRNMAGAAATSSTSSRSQAPTASTATSSSSIATVPSTPTTTSTT